MALPFMPTLSSGAFQNIGGAVSDLFEASALKTKAAGMRSEAQEFALAAGYADENVLIAAPPAALSAARKTCGPGSSRSLRT
jgi:hypothetical protein